MGTQTVPRVSEDRIHWQYPTCGLQYSLVCQSLAVCESRMGRSWSSPQIPFIMPPVIAPTNGEKGTGWREPRPVVKEAANGLAPNTHSNCEKARSRYLESPNWLPASRRSSA